METETLTYSPMSSITALETRCKFDEADLPGKLQSLVAKTNGSNFTEAIYEILDDVDGTGEVTLGEGGDHSAWIDGVETAISINQP